MTAGVGINLLALALLGGYVVWLAHPATEAVRLRNALLLQPSRPGDFSWIPPAFPEDYVREWRPASPEFCDVVSGLGVDAVTSDWGKALALSGHLTERAESKGPVQADLVTTYRRIRDGYGYCADFVKVFLALAHASGLDVRQWAFSFDGFGGHGHTVVEVFDRQRERWLLLDVFNNFYVVDEANGEPLGALEYRDALQRGHVRTALRRSGPGRPGFVHEHKAVEYYRRGLDQWYLVWSNAVFSYYAHPAVKLAGKVSRRLAHLVANVVGVQPRIRVYVTPANGEQVRHMLALRRRLIALAFLFALLLTTLLLQLAVGAMPTRPKP